MFVDGTGGRITFRTKGEGDLYGNDVFLRPSHLTTGANRSFIDIDNSLPAGVIERFYIYVHNVSSLDAQSRRIRLQIWRRTDPTLRRFQLVWQQLINVTAGYSTGALYSVRTLQPIHLVVVVVIALVVVVVVVAAVEVLVMIGPVVESVFVYSAYFF